MIEVPAHSFKFAAELQEKQTGNDPVLIRIDVKAAMEIISSDYSRKCRYSGIHVV
jgi:prolyl oligopeptidase PreP (S9A serine peptidase family)